MATFKATIEKIIDIQDHPNADRLSIATVLGYNVIIKKDEFSIGDTAVYIPTQAVLPENIIEELNLKGKLAGNKKNRVKETKLRGIFSEGLLYPNKEKFIIGTDVTEILNIKKYEQPIPKSLYGEIDNIGLDYSFKFDIENYKKHPDVIKDGEDVVFTEKLHGTCMIAGGVPDNKKDPKLFNSRYFVSSKGFMAKGLALKHNSANKNNTYLLTINKYNVLDAIDILSNEKEDTVYILGEIFGSGVQDLQYGADQNERLLRVFAIYVGQGHKKRALPSKEVDAICKRFNLERVPVLYEGSFSKEIMLKYTDGFESVSGQSKHIREGIVITTKDEKYHPAIGRVILKSISEDYLLRKGGTEFN